MSLENENFIAQHHIHPDVGPQHPLMNEHDNAEHHKALESPVDRPEVMFTTSEVDDVEILRLPGQKFIGLTKEELQEYVNDPFWKRLRWILFILFWAAWIGMFVAAIAIVIGSPSCPPKPKLYWWQKKIAHQVFTKSFRDSNGDGVGDLKGIVEKLPELIKIGVQTIWAVPILKGSDWSGYEVTSFDEVDPQLGTMEDFDSMISAIHAKDMYFIMDFMPAVISSSHPWVTDPSKSDWFVSKKIENDQTRAILNLSNQAALSEVTKSFMKWFEKGVDGFYIYSKYLALKPDGKTQDWPKTVSVLKHFHDAIIDHLNGTLPDPSERFLLFTSVDGENNDDTIESIKRDLFYDAELNLVISDALKVKTGDSISAEYFYDRLEKQMEFHKNFNKTWPMWEFGDPYTDRIATRIGGDKEHVELMTMLLLMMPGAINNYYGDEIGLLDVDSSAVNETAVNGLAKNYVMRSPMQWNSDDENAGFSSAKILPIKVNPNYKTVNYADQWADSKSPLRLFSKLAKLRLNDDTFLYGDLLLGPKNDSVLTLKKFYHSGLQYIAALNFKNVNVTVDLTVAPLNATDTVSVVEMTSNFDARGRYSAREVIDAKKIDLSGFEGILVKYKNK